MINSILLILAGLGLLFLYFQLKINGKEQEFMKLEMESLRKLREKNKKFSETGLFGLKMESSYLRIPGSKSGKVGRRDNLPFQRMKKIRRSPHHQLS